MRPRCAGFGRHQYLVAEERRLLRFTLEENIAKLTKDNAAMQEQLRDSNAKMDAMTEQMAQMREVIDNQAQLMERMGSAVRESGASMARTAMPDGTRRYESLHGRAAECRAPSCMRPERAQPYCRDTARLAARDACAPCRAGRPSRQPQEGDARLGYTKGIGIHPQVYQDGRWVPTGEVAWSPRDMQELHEQNMAKRELRRETQGGLLTRAERLTLRNNPRYAQRQTTRRNAEQLLMREDGWAAGSLNVQPLGTGQNFMYAMHRAELGNTSLDGDNYYDRTPGWSYADKIAQRWGKEGPGEYRPESEERQWRDWFDGRGPKPEGYRPEGDRNEFYYTSRFYDAPGGRAGANRFAEAQRAKNFHRNADIVLEALGPTGYLRQGRMQSGQPIDAVWQPRVDQMLRDYDANVRLWRNPQDFGAPDERQWYADWAKVIEGMERAAAQGLGPAPQQTLPLPGMTGLPPAAKRPTLSGRSVAGPSPAIAPSVDSNRLDAMPSKAEVLRELNMPVEQFDRIAPILRSWKEEGLRTSNDDWSVYGEDIYLWAKDAAGAIQRAAKIDRTGKAVPLRPDDVTLLDVLRSPGRLPDAQPASQAPAARPGPVPSTPPPAPPAELGVSLQPATDRMERMLSPEADSMLQSGKRIIDRIMDWFSRSPAAGEPSATTPAVPSPVVDVPAVPAAPAEAPSTPTPAREVEPGEEEEVLRGAREEEEADEAPEEQEQSSLRTLEIGQEIPLVRGVSLVRTEEKKHVLRLDPSVWNPSSEVKMRGPSMSAWTDAPLLPDAPQTRQDFEMNINDIALSNTIEGEVKDIFTNKEGERGESYDSLHYLMTKNSEGEYSSLYHVYISQNTVRVVTQVDGTYIAFVWRKKTENTATPPATPAAPASASPPTAAEEPTDAEEDAAASLTTEELLRRAQEATAALEQSAAETAEAEEDSVD